MVYSKVLLNYTRANNYLYITNLNQSQFKDYLENLCRQNLVALKQ